jgi:hypothetical protein
MRIYILTITKIRTYPVLINDCFEIKAKSRGCGALSKVSTSADDIKLHWFHLWCSQYRYILDSRVRNVGMLNIGVATDDTCNVDSFTYCIEVAVSVARRVEAGRGITFARRQGPW